MHRFNYFLEMIYQNQLLNLKFTNEDK